MAEIPVDPAALQSPDPLATPASQLVEEAGRQRDEQGKFVAPAPADGTPPQTPPEPKFGHQLTDLAKQAYFTDKQIDSFDDASMLFNAIRGRQIELQTGQPLQPELTPQPAMPTPTPAPAPPVPEPLLPDLELKFDEEGMDQDSIKPVKELATYVNKVKATLVAQMEKLREETALLQGNVQQSAKQVQQAASQQNVAFWDQIADAVPGLVEVIGKPSAALANLSSPQAKEWGNFAQAIVWTAKTQGVPENLVDFDRAMREAWSAHQAIKQRNGTTSGTPTGLPGVAVQGSPRQGIAPTINAHQTVAEDYDQRLAAMQNAFEQAGGNPFKR